MPRSRSGGSRNHRWECLFLSARTSPATLL
jgi:hypothetical protein